MDTTLVILERLKMMLLDLSNTSILYTKLIDIYLVDYYNN